MSGNLTCVVPETMGISSSDILEFIKTLEDSGTEMHGMMILRHGNVVAKGWWEPFSASMVHGSQSLTKTVTGTAYGIAELEGILSKDELIVDVFPEFLKYTKGSYWDELKVLHLLTMGSGMEKMPAVTDSEWIRKYFTMEIVHKPGTAFFYNSVACSLVGACIQKRSGMSIRDYLTPRLFDKIGMNAKNIKWLKHPDGLENCSGGILTTTEDNARMMQLYLQGGKWNGEQIISKEWAQMATKTLNPHIKSDEPDISYGGMMWIKGDAFYADGAMGQYAVGFPKQDMVISLNQTMASQKTIENVRKALFGFAQKAQNQALPANDTAYKKLQDKLADLQLTPVNVSACKGNVSLCNGRTMSIYEGRAVFFAEDFIIFNPNYTEDVFSFTLHFYNDFIEIELESEYGKQKVKAGLKGERILNTLMSKRTLATKVALNAWWSEENVLMLEIRWMESCRLHFIEFHLAEDCVKLISVLKPIGGFDVEPTEAMAKWVK